MSSHHRARVRAATIASHVAPSSSPSICHQLAMRPTNVVVAGEPATKIKQKKNYLDLENAEVSGDYPEELEVEVKLNPKTNQYELQPEPHTLSFDQGFFHVVRAIELLIEKNGASKVIVVGIAGPSGAGKSTLASKIAALFDGVVISLENFVKVEDVRDGNLEDPTLVDFEQAARVLQELKDSRTARVPQIDKGVRKEAIQVTLKPSGPGLVIVDGSYALNPALRPLQDVTIAINGGVHLDLIKRIVRDIVEAKVTSKDTLFQVSSVLFPMFKAFIEPDLEQAKITIQSTYNPMANLLEPTYVCKAKYSTVESHFEREFSGAEPQRTVFSDMYLYPPSKGQVDPMNQLDRANWIRIRRMGTHFHIHFYNEMMAQNMNTRPSINFEISVKTISGLLSLGYQIGAILNRSVEIWYDKQNVVITKEYIKELEQYYVQIKGKNRHDVLNWAEKLHINEHHIPQTFLFLYFRKLKKKKTKEQRK
eukprot:Phypoly_transcript_06907.p1 GENE.Phypoly_transcript_06907~~Phypoly_transcript_06907.p1  ORF type:complete len:479 (+),score=78.07 Phypoly_transcript_06907:25-1461(+)